MVNAVSKGPAVWVIPKSKNDTSRAMALVAAALKLVFPLMLVYKRAKVWNSAAKVA